MPIGRCCAVLLCLLAPALAHAQTGDASIVVQGNSEERKSDWRRAETAHVIVYSDGSEAELREVITDLERLHGLMSRIYRGGAQGDDTVKLQVTLFGDKDFAARLGLRNLRGIEGPYTGSLAAQRYYDPREDGDVLAIARQDQLLDLNTKRAEDLDCADLLAGGAVDCNVTGNGHGGLTSVATTYRAPLVRRWQASLYSAFAQHFLRTYTHEVFPRWYTDGVGAIFSTMLVRDDGVIDYARAPARYREFFRSYRPIDVGEVVTGRYLDAPETQWNPYQAWLVAHYFLFSKLKDTRSRQFRAYITAIGRGVPMAEAAQAFGDLRRLRSDLTAYRNSALQYARTAKPFQREEAPVISRLSITNAAMIEARLQLGARLDPFPGDGAVAEPWLDRLRSTLSALPYDPEALLVQAEAECRGGHADTCLALAERLLEKAPDDVRALSWKGVALTGQAIAGPAAERAATLAAARKVLERAIQLDGAAPLPLIAYFQSFARAGEKVPDGAMRGLALAIRAVPGAPAPRLYLAQELVRQNHAELARQVVYPLLYGADDTPEKRAAQALFAGSGAATAAR
ncbi:hypothetical protein P6144_09765 [Sphingomonas sp. HITSZ_GF]|uniref:tetratricopeptide repeat protein n=1 Tax=Sphingomonas sp. HITSZ_GF TaxID=3037247 RepID=UPI00240D4D3C|nr:hypothetical protein [Sphingomonas sp. HITSZ_GF]MDG2533932.1 hypothetical protein [Sphingomonas sp. HITSZ_GF]